MGPCPEPGTDPEPAFGVRCRNGFSGFRPRDPGTVAITSGIARKPDFGGAITARRESAKKILFSPSEQLEAAARALRIAAQLPSTAETQATIARLVGEMDESVHPLAEELKADPAAAVKVREALQS